MKMDVVRPRARFNNTARGRAAHPGERSHQAPNGATGVHGGPKFMSSRWDFAASGFIVSMGSRPWLHDAAASRLMRLRLSQTMRARIPTYISHVPRGSASDCTKPWVRCATQGFVVQPHPRSGNLFKIDAVGFQVVLQLRSIYRCSGFVGLRPMTRQADVAAKLKV